MASSPPTAETLLEEHRSRLRALALSLLRDPAAADDVLQDTWVVATESPPARKDNLPGWLRTVVRHLALRRLRGESRRSAREKVAAQPERLPSAAELTARLELERRLIDAVDALDEPYRHTIVWRYFEGYLPRQIAAIEGVPVATVKTRLSRAMAQLRAGLDERHGSRDAWAIPLAGAFSAPVAAATTSITVGATIGGVLMGKKILVAGALIALAWLGFYAWNAGNDTDTVPTTPEADALPRAATLEGAQPAAEPPIDIVDAAIANRLLPEDEIPATSFAGRVVDESGVGIAGAEVATFYSGAVVDRQEPINGLHLLPRRERERLVAPATTCDVDGYFRIDRPWRQKALLKASAEGYVPTVTFDYTTGSFVEITLRQEGALEVRVVDVDGARVRDAEVRLLTPQSGANAIPASVRRFVATAVTDASGRATLPQMRNARLLPADTELSEQYANRPWYWTTIEVAPSNPDLGIVKHTIKASDTEAEVTVPRVKTMERTIVDAETELPIPGAYVDVLKSYGYMSYENEVWRRRFLADAEGVVRIPFQKSYSSYYASAPGYMVVGAWKDRILLTRAMRIHGIVVDAAGAPVPDTPLFLVMTGGVFDRAYAGLSLVAAWSDAGGRFELDAKVANPAHMPRDLADWPDLGVRSLIAVHPDHPPAIVDEIEVTPGSERELVLRFPPGATIDLRIADVDGNPVVDQWVGCSRLIPRAETWPDEDDHGINPNGLVGHRRLRTDDDGRLQIDALAPGTYRVRAENLEAIVELAEGETKAVEMVKGGGPSITCVVLNADGTAATDAQVNLSGPEASSKGVDDEGRVRFDDLEPGEYTVGTYHPRYRFWVSTKAEPSDTEVVLQLPAGPAKLEIQVEGLPDDVMPGYSLMTRTGGYRPEKTGFTPMKAHTETTPGFTPGSGVLLVQAKGYAWTLVEFDAKAAETTSVGVSMTPAGTVTGTVEVERVKNYLVFLKRQDPPPLPKALDYAIRRSLGSVDGHAIVKEDGTFTAEDLAPGRYVVEYARWTPEAKWDVRARIDTLEVKSGEAVEVVLRAD